MTPRSDPHTEALRKFIAWSARTDKEEVAALAALAALESERAQVSSDIDWWAASRDRALARVVAAEARVTQLEGERDDLFGAARRVDRELQGPVLGRSTVTIDATAFVGLRSALMRVNAPAVSLVGFSAQNHRQQVGRRGALDKVDDRRTPRELWDALHEEFGFTMDVAASEANALTEDFYDLAADGLTRPWLGVVWCNPPYSDLRAWAEKALVEIAQENGPRVIVMLLPANRTEQGWWQDCVEPQRRAGLIETRFLRGRLRFDTPDRVYDDPKGNRPPFGNVLVILRGLTQTALPSPISGSDRVE